MRKVKVVLWTNNSKKKFSKTTIIKLIADQSEMSDLPAAYK